MPISSARRRAERHPTGIGPIGIATSRGPRKTNISSSNPGKLARARAIPRSKREARVGRGPPAGHIATGGIPARDIVTKTRRDTVPPIAAIPMSPTPGIGSMIQGRDMRNVRRPSRFQGCSGRIDAKLMRAFRRSEQFESSPSQPQSIIFTQRLYLITVPLIASPRLRSDNACRDPCQ